MEINESGARALMVALIQSAFADVRRLYRAGYISEKVQLTTKAMDDAVYRPYHRYKKGGDTRSTICRKHKEGTNSAMAVELVNFFRSQTCKEMLELFHIDADPVECAEKAIRNKHGVNGKREV